MSESTVPLRDRQPAVDEVASLLLSLTAQVSGRVSPREARAAAEAAAAAGCANWTELVERAGAAVGLRIGWVLAPADDMLPRSRPTRPLVARHLGGFVVVDGWRLGRARVRRLHPAPPDSEWVRPGVGPLPGLDEGAVIWAVVEPALPASALSSAPGSRLSPLRRLMVLAAAERDDLWAIVLYAVGAGILGLATPLAMQVLINWLAFGALAQPLIALTVGLLLCLALAAVLRVMQRVAVEMVQRRVFIRIAADVSSRLSRLRVGAFDGRSGPELVNRFFDAITVQKAVSSLMLDGSAAALQAIVGMVLLAAYHPVLLAFDIIVIGAYAGVLFALGRNGASTAINESKAKYKVAGWIEEVARHPVAFRLGGADRLAIDQTDALLDHWHSKRRAHFRVFMRQLVGSLVVQVVASAGLLLLCGWLVLDGQLTLGQLVAAEFVVTTMLAAFIKITGKLDSWYDLVAGVDKLGELVDLPCDPPVGVTLPGTGPASVRTEDLCTDKLPGHTLNLDLRPSARAALLFDRDVNTLALAEVLVGVRPADSGALLFDGLDSRSWHPDALHQGAALCTGTSVVHASIRDNIAMGRPGLDDSRVWETLEAVELAAVVRRIPSGLDTILGPTGSPLSPQQVVRLDLARALIGRPRLLVVDQLLDVAAPRERAEILTLISRPRSPWTLVVLTRDPAVGAMLPTTVDLASEVSLG